MLLVYNYRDVIMFSVYGKINKYDDDDDSTLS